MRNGEGLARRIARRLADLEAAGLGRAPRPPVGIDLSSNDYLNLSTHPALAERMASAAVREGCGSTGSRLLRGERERFRALEERFAAFKGTERSLYFSSGYLANLAVVPTLAEPNDVIFSDERNHASLIDAIRLSRARRVVFRHNDIDQLASLLRDHRGEGGEMFVVVESLFSMDGDFAPLAEYAALCGADGASLVVDEAHAVGVAGPRGSGLIESCAIDSEAVCVSINTAGKALGVAGAFVAGAASTIEYLVQRARPFVFSTAPPPPVAAALEASLDLVEFEPERRRRLTSRVERLRARLGDQGLEPPPSASHIVPIIVGDNRRAVAAARSLQARGFDVRAIRPPSVPEGTARLRISLNAGLSDDTIDRFVAALASTLREAGFCSAVSS
jgi:8-amino-7-oxononanoate synthase